MILVIQQIQLTFFTIILPFFFVYPLQSLGQMDRQTDGETKTNLKELGALRCTPCTILVSFPHPSFTYQGEYVSVLNVAGKVQLMLGLV